MMAIRWAVQGKRGGDWVTVPGPDSELPTRPVALQRMDVYEKLIQDAEWRVIRIRDLPRED